MTVEHKIQNYIEGHPEKKRGGLQSLHDLILQAMPNSKLWYSDGKNEEGKIVANPTIGYGSYLNQYADGTSKEVFQIGLSANTTGYSVYIMGLKDKEYLQRTFGKSIGKATVTGYCIRFKTLHDIDPAVLQDAIRCGVKETSAVTSE